VNDIVNDNPCHNLLATRKLCGATQTEMGCLLRISSSHYARCELGTKSLSGVATLVCHLLGVNWDQLNQNPDEYARFVLQNAGDTLRRRLSLVNAAICKSAGELAGQKSDRPEEPVEQSLPWLPKPVPVMPVELQPLQRLQLWIDDQSRPVLARGNMQLTVFRDDVWVIRAALLLEGGSHD